MPISANTLFHFTSSYENLLSILRHEFRPHYSLENLNVLSPTGKSTSRFVFAIPMVSFCDIPLSFVGNHMEVYGRYAIGMSKGWGRLRRIAPVLYTYRESRVAKTLFEMITAINGLPPDERSQNPVLDHFYEFTCFIKPYQGPLVRRETTKRKHRFYDEREWRYVPKINTSLYPHGMSRTAFNDLSRLTEANRSIPPNARLRFTPQQIWYIVVSTEEEIPSIMRDVETVKSRFSVDQVRLLVSRVISAEQILEDF